MPVKKLHDYNKLLAVVRKNHGNMSKAAIELDVVSKTVSRYMNQQYGHLKPVTIFVTQRVKEKLAKMTEEEWDLLSRFVLSSMYKDDGSMDLSEACQ